MLKWHFRLDVYWMLNLGCEPTYTQYQCLKNVCGLMFKLHLGLDAPWMLNLGCEPTYMYIQYQCLLDVEFRF